MSVGEGSHKSEKREQREGEYLNEKLRWRLGALARERGGRFRQRKQRWRDKVTRKQEG